MQPGAFKISFGLFYRSLRLALIELKHRLSFFDIGTFRVEPGQQSSTLGRISASTLPSMVPTHSC